MLHTVEPNESSVEPDSASARLEAGDHLEQSAFHRLYEASPPDFRAELIEGVVIVPSPTRPDHGDVQAVVMGLLWVYRVGTPGVRTYDNTSVILPPINEPQPDAVIAIESECGGQMRIEDGYLYGAPELVIEVASSSVSYDLHSKYRMYERMGVREYAVLIVKKGEARWFTAEGGRFVALSPDEHGVFRSRVFPGLWLDAPALWSDNGAKLMDTIQRGLASAEHAAFVEKLRSQRG
jgi:Uma2 family endonuclease